MDFAVELPESSGFTNIVRVVDRFPKMVHFIPCTGFPFVEKTAQLWINNEVFLASQTKSPQTTVCCSLLARGPTFIRSSCAPVLCLLSSVKWPNGKHQPGSLNNTYYDTSTITKMTGLYYYHTQSSHTIMWTMKPQAPRPYLYQLCVLPTITHIPSTSDLAQHVHHIQEKVKKGKGRLQKACGQAKTTVSYLQHRTKGMAFNRTPLYGQTLPETRLLVPWLVPDLETNEPGHF